MLDGYQTIVEKRSPFSNKELIKYHSRWYSRWYSDFKVCNLSYSVHKEPSGSVFMGLGIGSLGLVKIES